MIDAIVAGASLLLALLTAINVYLTSEVIRAPWRCVMRLRSVGREGDRWVAEVENLGPGPASAVAVSVPLETRVERPGDRPKVETHRMRGPQAVDSNEVMRYELPVERGRLHWDGRLSIGYRTVCRERRVLNLPLEEQENRPDR